MTPRVSFVIPAYNAEVYLRDTLDSCLHQSEKKLEVIVVNDGSTDGTKELVEFYAKKDKRVRLIHLDANVGRSEARNIGNREAKADIICVLDADDMATRDRVKNTIICFETKKPDIMYGGWIQIDTFGNMERRIAPQPFSKEQSLKYKTHFICHSSVAYRKGVTLNIQYQGGIVLALGLTTGGSFGTARSKATSSPTRNRRSVTTGWWKERFPRPGTSPRLSMSKTPS
jgi:glycosyltransferase involved in cell wall biosynthesis